MPILTDWLETGTLPPHLHDYLTEIVIGGMMAAAVWLLYRERAELRALAQTDSLTGLRNQRRFREDLESEVERAARLGTELVLAYLDVDDFKSVNDRHGHVAGDEVLKRVGHALGALRGRVDRCYRVGGDEFAVLMPGASAADALRAISRATSLAQPTPGAQAPVVTLSVGAVELAPGEEPAALLARADRFMYGAKRDSADLFQEGASAGHVTLEG
jgi:diguanylate cyclase (GGDEF)-like protein